MSVRVLIGDVRERLKGLPDESLHCVVTSPPYFGLRDYGMAGQIGLEETPDAFVAEMVAVFREVRRVLRKDGTLWLNLGDSYFNTAPDSGGKCVLPGAGKAMTESRYHSSKRDFAGTGLKPKDMIGIPWRVAFALQADGWWLRQDIIWHKPNPMPESVTDRCTKAHEYLFLLAKSKSYYYDAGAISEATIYPEGPGNKTQKYTTAYLETGDERLRTKAGLVNIGPRESRNKRSVWSIATNPFAEAHFATFPPELPELCIRAGCPPGGTVLDPFGGAGTTGMVADRLGRDAILIEINPEYAAIAERRLVGDAGMFAQIAAE
jgi:DNA modification methylase